MNMDEFKYNSQHVVGFISLLLTAFTEQKTYFSNEKKSKSMSVTAQLHSMNGWFYRITN